MQTMVRDMAAEGSGTGFQGSGGGSALYIEWWPSSGGGSDSHAPGSGDDYFTLTKTSGNCVGFPDSSLNPVVNIFNGCSGEMGDQDPAAGGGVGITFAPNLDVGPPPGSPPLSAAGTFTIENEGNYLITLNLHLTAADGWLADTSCNVKIINGTDWTTAIPNVLASVPLGIGGIVDYSGGIEQTITCVKPLANNTQISFWLENHLQFTNIRADVGTTANFARIGGGGGRGVMVQGSGKGSVVRTKAENYAGGAYSAAIGYDCSATVDYSVALGYKASTAGAVGFMYRDGGELTGGTSHTLKFDSGNLWTDSSNITQEIANHDASLVALDASMITRAPLYAPIFTGAAGQYPRLSLPNFGTLPPTIDDNTYITAAWCLEQIAGGGGGGGGASAAGMVRHDFTPTASDVSSRIWSLPEWVAAYPLAQHPVWGARPAIHKHRYPTRQDPVHRVRENHHGGRGRCWRRC